MISSIGYSFQKHFLCVCGGSGGGVYAIVCMGGQRLACGGRFSSSTRWVLGPTRIIRLGGRCLYLLNHLASPHLFKTKAYLWYLWIFPILFKVNLDYKPRYPPYFIFLCVKAHLSKCFLSVFLACSIFCVHSVLVLFLIPLQISWIGLLS